MNRLKTTAVVFFFIGLLADVFGQYSDERIEAVINSGNDRLLKTSEAYRSHAVRYRESVLALGKLMKRADSARHVIRNSSLPMEAQRIAFEMIELSVNKVPDDVSVKVRASDPSLILSINKSIPLEFIYQLERNYQARLLTIAKISQWAVGLLSFIQDPSINYVNADRVNVPDSVFLSEVRSYQFRKHEVIADIGAGTVISKKCFPCFAVS